MNTTVLNSANHEITSMNTVSRSNTPKERVMGDDMMFFVKMTVAMAVTIVFLATAYVDVVSLF